MAQHPSYLKGLNTLRFFAAFFVIFAHGHRSLLLLGVLPESNLKLFDRGGSAVELFFTLSGFLITYLLLLEIGKTRTVDIRFFYLRRVLRIWPLYFLCVAAGIFVLKVLIPRTTHQSNFYFPLWPFFLFIPNFAATYYKVGLLFPLWSIGIEEQFYLLWAPLVRFFRNHLLALIAGGVILTTTFYCIVAFALRSQLDPTVIDFLLTIKFHNMLIGTLFAYIVVFQIDRYRRSFLSHPVTQLLLLMAVIYHYLVGIYPVPEVIAGIAMSFIYGCVFVNLSSIARPITDLEFQPFIYLGEISFGLYIYHMFVDYTLRLGFGHVHIHLKPIITAVIYLSLLLTITIVVAAFSHRFYEAFFLNLRRHYRAKPVQSSDDPLQHSS
jgi:peptidoglycan/LPS O-acetylase OafA/YrhL